MSKITDHSIEITKNEEFQKFLKINNWANELKNEKIIPSLANGMINFAYEAFVYCNIKENIHI